MFGLFKKKQPPDVASQLVNQAIGGQSVIYRFFREGLECEDDSILKLELTFFAMSVLTVAYLAVSQDPQRQETLDQFSEQMLKRAIAATQSNESLSSITASYQQRYSEYQSILRPLLNPATTKDATPPVALLLHAFEKITDSSAKSHMVKIMAGARIAQQFVADNLDFVRNGLRREA